MDVTRTEEEQLEALKEWWKQNGTSIIVGLAIGISAVFGWRGWQSWQADQATEASDLYATLIVEVREQNRDKARAAANQILADYSKTGYVSFAALLLAKLDIEENKLDDAIKHLQLALDKAKSEEFEHLARIRLARAQLANQQPAEALKTLDVSNKGKFVATYQELTGDIYIVMNKPNEARESYLLAQSELNDPSGSNNAFLQMKIDNINLANQ